jgi:transposase-like protein
VDSTGQTIEFMLSAKRDVSAAKWFFKKIMRADHRRFPFTISVDKQLHALMLSLHLRKRKFYRLTAN